MIHISIPIIVEGRYDKAKLANLTDANIIVTDGFGIFNSKEKNALIRRLSANGVIILCDSDGAGGVIRSHIKSILKDVPIYNLYTKQIKGKERRKKQGSKEGFLGVEGIADSELTELLETLIKNHPEISDGEKSKREEITKADFFALGLSGGDNSSVKRDEIAKMYSLPVGMSANSLLAALNMLTSKDELYEKAGEIE